MAPGWGGRSAVSSAPKAVTCREEGAPAGTLVSTHVADVSNEADVVSFQAAVADAHQTDHVHLVFNNAGIGGGGSMIVDDREQWDKTFDVCWGGVYYSTARY